MAVAEELQIIIDAKVTQAVKDLKKVQDGLGGNEKKAFSLSKAFKSLAGPLAIGAVIGGAIKLTKELSRAASNAEEIESKFRTVFRDIGDSAENAAQRLADSFDLADSTAQDLLGTTGDLLTGLGFTQDEALGLSEQVNTLAVDLASFSNFSGGAAGASEALTKALLGESEMAKGLGIVINQNTQEYKDAIKFYTEVEGKTLLQAKAYTALQFATEQSGNAIGDYSRTSESAANVSRRLEQSQLALKEALGESVNEGLTPLKSILADINKSLATAIDQSNQLSEAHKAVAEGTADAGQELKVLDTEIATAVGQVNALKSGYAAQTDAMKAVQEASQLRIDAMLIERKAVADGIALEARWGAQRQAQAKIDAGIAAKKAAEAKQAADDLAILKTAFDSTLEGQIAAAEAQIAFFETFAEGPMSIAVLADLNEQLATLIGTGDDGLTGAIIHLDNFYASSLQGSQAFVEGMGEQTAAVEELDEMLLNLATSGMGAFASAFKRVGEEGVTVWDVLKQAGKDTMSAVLEGLAQQALVRAALAAASFNFASAAGFTAAAAGAYAASGVVQSFATGGDFVANQPQMIQVGEAGPEEVTVNPVSGGGSGGGSERVFASVDGGEGFWMTIQRGIDNRNIRSGVGGAI